MRKVICALCLCAVGVIQAGVIDDSDIWKRGDANHSGGVNIADAIYINAFLFQGGPAPPCMNEADANDDAHLDGSDAAYLINWLFGGGSAPPAPGSYNTTCTHESNAYISCGVGCP